MLTSIAYNNVIRFEFKILYEDAKSCRNNRSFKTAVDSHAYSLFVLLGNKT